MYLIIRINARGREAERTRQRFLQDGRVRDGDSLLLERYSNHDITKKLDDTNSKYYSNRSRCHKELENFAAVKC